jgi:glutathione peroxidase
VVVLGFPCNQFGAQEPGTEAEIAQFCELNYGVSFPIFAKIDVNGSNAHPLYKFSRASDGSGNSWKSRYSGDLGAIKWNFHQDFSSGH